MIIKVEFRQLNGETTNRLFLSGYGVPSKSEWDIHPVNFVLEDLGKHQCLHCE